MKPSKSIIVTKGEALQLFGIKPGTLDLLEQEAGVAYKRKRIGYTSAELGRLHAALDRIME
ncbi:MAG: hypothetical protein ABII00_05515 [Elusimicrobiota bacterium]